MNEFTSSLATANNFQELCSGHCSCAHDSGRTGGAEPRRWRRDEDHAPRRRRAHNALVWAVLTAHPTTTTTTGFTQALQLSREQNWLKGLLLLLDHISENMTDVFWACAAAAAAAATFPLLAPDWSSSQSIIISWKMLFTFFASFCNSFKERKGVEYTQESNHNYIAATRRSNCEDSPARFLCCCCCVSS